MDKNNKNQVYRKDGRETFIEVLTTSFNIGKVILNFVSYNSRMEKNSKITAYIPIYMDFAEFLSLASQINSGLLAKKITWLKDQAKQKNTYPGAAFNKMGGTSHQKQNKKRPDGAAESRRFYIRPSAKADYALTAEKGKGVEDPKTKLIKPAGAAEVSVTIAFSDAEMRAMFNITCLHIQSFIQREWNSGVWLDSPKPANSQPVPYSSQNRRVG